MYLVNMAPESLGLAQNMRQCKEFIVDGYHSCYLHVISAKHFVLFQSLHLLDSKVRKMEK